MTINDAVQWHNADIVLGGGALLWEVVREGFLQDEKQMESMSQIRPVPLNCLACTIFTILLVAFGALNHIPLVTSDFSHGCDCMNADCSPPQATVVACLVRGFSPVEEATQHLSVWDLLLHP